VTMSKHFTCEMPDGTTRCYVAHDSGEPLFTTGSASEYRHGGIVVFRCDGPFRPLKGNAYVDNFEGMADVRAFLRCMRMVVKDETKCRYPNCDACDICARNKGGLSDG